MSVFGSNGQHCNVATHLVLVWREFVHNRSDYISSLIVRLTSAAK